MRENKFERDRKGNGERQRDEWTDEDRKSSWRVEERKRTRYLELENVRPSERERDRGRESER